MDGNKFWVAIWRIIAVTFCVFVLSVAGCEMRNKQIIKDAVTNSKDPIATRCAMDYMNMNLAIICAIKVSK